MAKALFVNYSQKDLLRHLAERGYHVISTSALGGVMPSNLENEELDLTYYAKFTPPYWDDVKALQHCPRGPLVYGFHTPSFIFRPYRPNNYACNFLSCVKLVYFSSRRLVTAFHVLNTDEHRLLTSLGLKVVYAPLGVDTELFRPGDKNREFTVACVSARYQKGTDMLLQIVPEVIRQAPDAQFLLLGGGHLSGYFDLLRQCYPDNVNTTGFVQETEFIRVLSSAHVLLFPSRWESFGLIVPEALSTGTPVVCYDIAGAPRDIVKKFDVGYVATPFDRRGIVEGILRFNRLWKESSYAELSLRCRSCALEFDWRNVAALFAGMFERVLSGRDD